MPDLTVNFEFNGAKRAVILHPKEACRKCFGRGVTSRMLGPDKKPGQWIMCRCVAKEWDYNREQIKREQAILDAAKAAKPVEVPA